MGLPLGALFGWGCGFCIECVDPVLKLDVYANMCLITNKTRTKKIYLHMNILFLAKARIFLLLQLVSALCLVAWHLEIII